MPCHRSCRSWICSLSHPRSATQALPCVAQGVTLTKRDAREAVKKLLRGNVVLVGHALQNDLDALQLSPAAFIDTALLYFFV